MDTRNTLGGTDDGSGAGARQAPGAEPPVAPPKVIRGTSPSGNGSGGSATRTKVDYLTVSCREDRFAIRRCLEEAFSGSPVEPVFEPGPGMRHFAKSDRILVAGMPCGVMLTGGESQRGRACVDVSGVGVGSSRIGNGPRRPSLPFLSAPGGGRTLRRTSSGAS